jgi:hypothetical protein
MLNNELARTQKEAVVPSVRYYSSTAWRDWERSGFELGPPPPKQARSINCPVLALMTDWTYSTWMKYGKNLLDKRSFKRQT